MTTHRLVKSMTRPLTKKEEETLLGWWEDNQDVPIKDVIDKYEGVFKMQITEHAIVKAMMKRIPR